MPISFSCSCGKKLNAPDSFANKKAKCPACQQAVLVPSPNGPAEEEIPEVMAAEEPEDPGFEVVDDEEDNERVPRRRRSVADDEEANERVTNRRGSDDLPRKSSRLSESRRSRDEEDEFDDREEDRPRPKKKKPKKKAVQAGGGMTNAGVIGGILLMLGAVAWFVGGLFFDIVFFYPPIMFVLGVIAVLKGVFSR